uniref:Carbonic anhydrase n=1 Tax=Aegilops tauschii subsp. strangulata TaxID=200361 RepID=A0A453KYU9_AEGTS
METARRRRAGAAGPAFASAILVIFAFSCSSRGPAFTWTILVIFAFLVRNQQWCQRLDRPTVASNALFNYKDKDPTGPDKWAKLNKGWAACGDGKKQCPIDICKVEINKDMGPLDQAYKSSACTLENRGHDFILQWKGGNGKLTIEKKDYVLQQVHWHVPSEHTVNGTRFDMELHMVHEDSSKARAVISVLYSTKEAGDPDKT